MPRPYTGEDVLAQRFAALLDRPGFDKGGVAWVSQATRVSHGDEKQHREDAIRRLGDHRLPPGQQLPGLVFFEVAPPRPSSGNW